ncbi:hypothetical protein [Streptomyces sp. NPDC003015]
MIARQPLSVADRGCAECTATTSGAAPSHRPDLVAPQAISGDTPTTARPPSLTVGT